jgi:hypothetical protein
MPGPSFDELITLLREREARIDDLTGQLIATAEAATLWQARAGMLADRLAAVESKLLALEAPPAADSAVAGSGAPESENPTLEPLEPPSARWRQPWPPWPLLALGAAVAVIVMLVVLPMPRW